MQSDIIVLGIYNSDWDQYKKIVKSRIFFFNLSIVKMVCIKDHKVLDLSYKHAGRSKLVT